MGRRGDGGGGVTVAGDFDAVEGDGAIVVYDEVDGGGGLEAGWGAGEAEGGGCEEGREEGWGEHFGGRVGVVDVGNVGGDLNSQAQLESRKLNGRK